MNLSADGWRGPTLQQETETAVCSLDGCHSDEGNRGGCFLLPQAGRKWAQQYSNELLNSNQATDRQGSSETDDAMSGDDGIAEALNRLTFQQREDAYHDIHGVESKDMEEDPEMIRQQLKELDKHLNAILNESSTRVSALKEAMEQNPAYVCDESFRLSFLRADGWKPSDAAERINRFFQVKSELFPREKLTKDITQSDLDEEDRAFLSSGTMQAIPLKDRSGRSIIISLIGLNPPVFTGQSAMRQIFYMYMALIKDDVATQRQGFVEMLYMVGCKKTINLRLASSSSRLCNALPVKSAGVHACSDDPFIRMFFGAARPFMSLHRLSRSRIHLGGHMEVQYELMSYGIPLEALPVDATGNLSTRHHLNWLRWRNQLEQGTAHPQIIASSVVTDQHSSTEPFPNNYVNGGNASVTVPMIITSSRGSRRTPSPTILMEPEDNDCIVGRGKAIDRHPGNIRFRSYLEQKEILEWFRQTPKYVKFEVAVAIQRKLQEEYNMRFLIENPNGFGWVFAKDDIIRSKILRTLRRSLSKKREQATSTLS